MSYQFKELNANLYYTIGCQDVTNATEIQKLTNIPIVTIYRNLKKLNAKGNNDRKKGSGRASKN